MQKFSFNLGLGVLLTLWLVWGSHMIGEAAFPGPPAVAEEMAMPEEEVAEEAAEPVVEVAAVNPADLTGDVGSGKKVFNKCKACHAVEAGKNKVGPYLAGIMDRAKGEAQGYNYSEALLAVGGTWSADNLYAFLKDPKGYAPGNKMSFKGLKDPQDLADVVAYLASLP